MIRTLLAVCIAATALAAPAQASAAPWVEVIALPSTLMSDLNESQTLASSIVKPRPRLP